MIKSKFSNTGILVFCSLLAPISAINASIIYSFPLESSQAVPASVSQASGRCIAKLDDNDVDLNVVCSHDIADATAVHIHTGASGDTGPISLSFDSANSPFSGDFKLSNDDLLALQSGNFYVNLHSPAVASGELRGQIDGNGMPGYNFSLSGSNEVPAIDSTTAGSCFAALDEELFTISCSHDIGDASAVHLHSANLGTNGGVAFTFDSVTSPMIQSFEFSADDMMRLKAQNLYVNIHSDEFPAGELRAQVSSSDDMAFNFAISSVQESPPIMSEAEGECSAVLNREETELAISCSHSAMNPTGVHIHQAGPGENGAISFAFDSAESPFLGLWELSVDDVTALKARNLYVNLHTDTNAAGELRGQINRIPDGTYAGTYFNVNRSGEGVLLEVAGENPPTLVFTWYTYGPSGGEGSNQLWLLGTSPLLSNQASFTMTQTSGGSFGSLFSSDDVIRTEWGTVKVSFTSCTTLIIEYSPILPGFESGVVNYQRLTPPLTAIGACN